MSFESSNTQVKVARVLHCKHHFKFFTQVDVLSSLAKKVFKVEAVDINVFIPVC